MKLITKILTLSSVMCILTLFALTTNATTYTPASTTTYNAHEYQVYLVQLTWTDAQKYCESLGGHLVTLETAEEGEHIKTLLNDNSLWIGALSNGYYDENDNIVNNEIRWITTGEEIDDSYIEPELGEPSLMAKYHSIGFSPEYSPHLLISNFFEHNIMNGFICEIEPTKYELPESLLPISYDNTETEESIQVSPANKELESTQASQSGEPNKYTPIASTIIGDHEYRIYTTELTWADAEAYCESIGGHLVTLETADEKSQILNLLNKNNGFWIGATSLEMDIDSISSEGCQKWITNEAPLDSSLFNIELCDTPSAAPYYLIYYNDLDEYNEFIVTNAFHYNTYGFICEIEPTKYQFSHPLSSDNSKKTSDIEAVPTESAPMETSEPVVQESASEVSENSKNNGVSPLIPIIIILPIIIIAAILIIKKTHKGK